MTRPLHQQVVVITGASSGIGRQTARRFAQAGARVVIAARRGELLEELAQELEDEGHAVLPVVTDVTVPEQLMNLVETTLDRFEWIDTWVNNAGTAVFGPFDQIAPEDFEREIQVTLMSQIYAARAVMPIMKRQRSGTIINVCSLFGKVPAPLYSAYVTAEFGLVGFTESVRQELRGTGIELCMVMPANVDTPFFDHARGAYGLKPRPFDPVYSPDTVAATILDCAARPRNQMMVGWATRTMALLERFAPGLSHRRMSRMTRQMLDTETPIPYIDSLYSPTPEGREERGGWGTTRERLSVELRHREPFLRAALGAVMVGAGLALAWKMDLFGQRRGRFGRWVDAQLDVFRGGGGRRARRLLKESLRLISHRLLLEQLLKHGRHAAHDVEARVAREGRRAAHASAKTLERAKRRARERFAADVQRWPDGDNGFDRHPPPRDASH